MGFSRKNGVVKLHITWAQLKYSTMFMPMAPSRQLVLWHLKALKALTLIRNRLSRNQL